MARSNTVAARAEELLGKAVAATAPIAGGDICVATRLRLSDGTSAVIKTLANAPADFFGAEADGLRWLGATTSSGGVAVPEVLAVDQDCLIVAFVEPGKPTVESAEAFGRALAATHQAGAETFGAATNGYIGALPMLNRPCDSWAEFYATRRLLPYLKLAVDRGGIGTADAAALEEVARRLPDLAGEPEPPSRIHGDLWSGNVLWGTESAWVIDPAAHGGHRETDLAMLALFGLRNLAQLLAAYDEAYPLADGWRDRVGLHQLFPLLTHATHKHGGGAYGARAGEVARRLLAS
ncbi:MAG: fructosamine kinase family protein [Nocardioidaceae bacterium]|nr:MAG: fructosamine kinase family protein [Nocardioidaceae bacterium]